MTFWVNYKQNWTKASKTIIPTWTLHIFFVIILILHLKNWFKVILHSLTMATVCAKYEQHWPKKRFSITCIWARTLHIFSAMNLIKFCSRSLYTLWSKGTLWVKNRPDRAMRRENMIRSRTVHVIQLWL